MDDNLDEVIKNLKKDGASEEILKKIAQYRIESSFEKREEILSSILNGLFPEIVGHASPQEQQIIRQSFIEMYLKSIVDDPNHAAWLKCIALQEFGTTDGALWEPVNTDYVLLDNTDPDQMTAQQALAHLSDVEEEYGDLCERFQKDMETMQVDAIFHMNGYFTENRLLELEHMLRSLSVMRSYYIQHMLLHQFLDVLQKGAI